MFRVERWANARKLAAAATLYVDEDHTYRGIKHIDMVHNLSPSNLAAVAIGKDFMLTHGYIENDFDVKKWAVPEFIEQAAQELLEADWKKIGEDKLSDVTGCSTNRLLNSTRRIG